MPEITNLLKIAATKGYGASVVFSGSTSTAREEAAAKVIAETGARLVPPYNHPDVLLGQGTLGLEMQQQVAELIEEEQSQGGAADSPAKASGAALLRAETTRGREKGQSGRKKGLDAIITPCGGGGMLSGVALSCEGTGIRVFGSEPSFEGADDGKRGYESGQRVTEVKSLTVAEGLRTPVGEHPWGVIYGRKLVSGFFSVTDDEIKATMRLVLERFKMVVEPSGCVPLAVALLDEEFRSMVEKEAGEEGWDLGIVFSGGNAGVEVIGKLFS